MPKLTDEERILRAAEREKKQKIREQRKLEKESLKAVERERRSKTPPSEADLVRGYANRVIKNAMYHGRVDNEKFSGLEHDRTVSKQLWLDQDFFFSVVFQSSEQKREFLRRFLSGFKGEVDANEDYGIQIINGLELAQVLGIELKLETTKAYPLANIDLMPLVLDNESILKED